MTNPEPTSAAASGDDRVPVVEGHRDCYEQIHWQNFGEDNPVRDRLLPRLVAGGVDVVVYAIGGDTLAHSNGRDKRLLMTLENIYALRNACRAEPQQLAVATAPQQLPTVADGMHRFVLHIEGGGPLEGSLTALEALYDAGLRSIQPTWNVRNELGDGVHERDTGGGLTRFGVQVLRRAEELGMQIDLSHISEAGFWHTLRVTEGPVVVTHANAKAVHDHPRNLSDEQVRAIGERAGVVGVHTLPTFVGGQDPSTTQLVDHVEHLVEVAGIDHVAFGGDFVKCDGPRPGREALFHDPRVPPPVLSDLSEADEVPNLSTALLQRGFKPAEAAAVTGGNLLRVLRSVMTDGASR